MTPQVAAPRSETFPLINSAEQNKRRGQYPGEGQSQHKREGVVHSAYVPLAGNRNASYSCGSAAIAILVKTPTM